MDTVKLVLDKIINDQYDFCYLCFNTIGEGDKCYNILDEIVYPKKKSINLLEILSCVIGDEIIKYLTDLVTVCHTCTEAAMQTYAFITNCKEKSLQLQLAIKALSEYFEINEEINMCNTLFACIDPGYKIKCYNVNTETGDRPSDILNMLQTVPKIEQNILIEIEQENEPDADIPKETENMQCNDTVNLIDIIYDKNNLSLLKCKVCHNTFSRAPNLKKHYRVVHAPKVYKCPLCPKSFSTTHLLKSHQNHVHCSAVCTECGKVYSNLYTLRIHEKRHKIRYICQHCGKVYKTKHAFQSHLDKSHHGITNKKNFTCDYCGKNYSQKSAIRVHIQFEHGNGAFCECDWCKKKFSSISRLKEHIITHTKEKRFGCEICGGRFATKKSLLYHTRLHTGERPYQCQYCDTSFLSASRRMTHVKQHHMTELEECDVCHKKFKLRTYLLRHRHRHFNPTSKLHNSV